MQNFAIAGARRAVCALAFAGAVAGCTPGPDYAAPEIALADRYAVVLPVRLPEGEAAQWWRAFEDPVFETLVSAALVQNLSLAEARARLQEAEAEARRAGAGGVSGNATLEGQTGSAGDSLQAGLSVLPDLTGGQRRRAEAAIARLQAAQFGVAEAQRRVLGELGTAYVELRFFQHSRLLRQQDLRSRRATLNDITAQVEGGAATRLDLLRARALVAETEAEIPRLEADILRQRQRIATLLGRPAADLPVDLGPPGRQPLPRAAATVGVPADLLRLRPDIRAAERRYAAAVSEIGAAEAARYPQLSLSGLIRAPLSGGSASDTLTAGLTLPLLSQGALAAGVEVQEARAAQAYLQWRLAVLGAVEEVEGALAALAAAQQAARAAAAAVALNEESLALSRQLLESGGNATVLDLLDRERAVSAARATLARSRRDIGRDHVALQTALGR